jgi:hypothetical protein
MTPAETATALATDVLAEASRRGIALTAQGDRLECASPKGAMTPEFRAMLVEHKPEVMRLLRLPFVVGPPQPPPGSDPATWHPAWRQLAREQAAMRRMLDGVTWAESEYLTYRNLTDPRLAGIYRPEGLDPAPTVAPAPASASHPDTEEEDMGKTTENCRTYCPLGDPAR